MKKTLQNVSLDYFWYEPVNKGRHERLEFALEELQVSAIRLRQVTERLVATEEIELVVESRETSEGKRHDSFAAVSSLVDELKYHGESFLAATYELQDRLASLLAILGRCRKRDVSGFRGAFNKARMPRYRALEKSMPETGKQFIILERHLCDFVRLRNRKTHEASLHFALLVDGQPHTPEDVLQQIKGGRQWFLDIIREEARRFSQRHEHVLKTIQVAVDKLVEDIRSAEELDH